MNVVIEVFDPVQNPHAPQEDQPQLAPESTHRYRPHQRIAMLELVNGVINMIGDHLPKVIVEDPLL